MKIVISGDAAAFKLGTDSAVSDTKVLKQLDGVEFTDDECGQYIDGSLYDIGIQGGKVFLSWDKQEGLRVVTEYHAPSRLNSKDVNQLVVETEAQWSDGIGEGEFLHREKFNVDVSIGMGSTRVQQVEDGKKVKKPRGKKIIKALEDSNYEEAMELVLNGENLDCRSRWKKTPLHFACNAGEADLAILMINYGADVNAVCEIQDTPLLSLAHCQRSLEKQARTPEIAERLLDQGAHIEVYNESGHSPLTMAVNRGNRPLVDFLLDRGADINQPDANEGNHMTPIMYASTVPMVEYLLKRGADPSIQTDYGMNAAEYVLQNDHMRECKEIAALLQKHLKS